MKMYYNPDFLNTSEAFSRNIFISNDIVVVPYIGLNIIRGNPIVQNGGFLNFSYYIFENVSSLRIQSESTLMFAKYSGHSEILHREYIIVGGYYKEYNGAELEISYKTSLLLLPHDFEYSMEPLIPKDYPLMRSNMSSDKIELFFDLVDAPNSLMDRLGKNYWVLTL